MGQIYHIWLVPPHTLPAARDGCPNTCVVWVVWASEGERERQKTTTPPPHTAVPPRATALAASPSCQAACPRGSGADPGRARSVGRNDLWEGYMPARERERPWLSDGVLSWHALACRQPEVAPGSKDLRRRCQSHRKAGLRSQLGPWRSRTHANEGRKYRFVRAGGTQTQTQCDPVPVAVEHSCVCVLSVYWLFCLRHPASAMENTHGAEGVVVLTSQPASFVALVVGGALFASQSSWDVSNPLALMARKRR